MRPIAWPNASRSRAYLTLSSTHPCADADGQRRDRDAALVEDAQEVGIAAAALAEQVLFGHPHIVEAQRVGVRGVPADLVVGGFDGESRGGRRNQDRRDLLLAVPPRRSLR